MIQDIEAAIRAYLPDIIHMSLATSSDDKPHVCQVHFAYDDDLNIYFRSKSASRHCQELTENPQVAGNIATQHTVKDKPRCVSFEGTAAVMNSESERASVLKHFARIGADESALEDAKNTEGHQFYKIAVNKFYLFDARESKPSQKYLLDWPK